MNKKAKYKNLDVFYHKEKNIFMMVDNVDFYPHKGFLYTLKVMKETHPSEYLLEHDNWKKYYETKLDDECVLMYSQDSVRTLYGKAL